MATEKCPGGGTCTWTRDSLGGWVPSGGCPSGCGCLCPDTMLLAGVNNTNSTLHAGAFDFQIAVTKIKAKFGEEAVKFKAKAGSTVVPLVQNTVEGDRFILPCFKV